MSRDELAVQVAALREEIGSLADAVGKLASRQTVAELAQHSATRTRRLVAGLAVSLALEMLLTGYLVWTNARVNAVQQRTSNEVLCPLYELFLRSYHPEVQPAEKLAEYEDSFVVIRRSYAVLDCDKAGG